MAVLSSRRTIRVATRSVENTIPITVFRHKFLDKFVYREEVLNNECQIAYIGYEPITFSNSTGLTTPLSNLEGNRPALEGNFIWRVFNGRYFTLKDSNVWLTNKVIIDGQREVPLFFGMKLPATTINASLGFYHRREKDVYWEYDADAKVMYCSETNYWDPNLKDYKAFVVNYTYTNETGSIISRQDLFRSEPVFSEATFLDIDPDTLEIFPGRLVYMTSQRLNGDIDFEVNTEGPIYVAPRKESNIEIRRSGFQNIEEPWHLEFTNGSFENNGNHYSIREYEEQAFYPRYPYKTYWHKAEVLEKDLLKLPLTGLIINPAEYIDCDLIIRDKQGLLLRALTTSSVKLNKPFDRWSIGNEDSVFWEALSYSYDRDHSILQIKNDSVFLDTDIIYVQYVVDNNTYVYQDINLNPAQNLLGVNRQYYIYMIPDSLEGPKSVYYFAFEYTESGNIIVESNHDETIVSGVIVSNDIIGKDIEFFETKYFPYGIIKAGIVSLQESFNIEDILVQDIRLKQLINFKKQIDVLNKYPWIYYTKKFDSKDYEFPDKYFTILEVDKQRVIEQNEDKYEAQIRKHLSPAHTLFKQPGGLQPRVYDIYSISTDKLTVKTMSPPPGAEIKIYHVQTNNNVPDPNVDTLVYSGAIPYSTSLYEFDINYSPAENIVRLYMVVTQGNYISNPSKVYTVKIR